MKFRFYSILILICLFYKAANAQDSSRTHRFSISGNYFYDIPRSNWNISGLQVGYGWQNKKHNWHDIDLTGGYSGFMRNSHYLALGLRYQYTIMLFKRFENTRFKPFIGLGAEYNISHSKNEYNSVVTRIDVRHFTNMLQPYVSPGFEFNFSKKFYSSLQFPIPLLSINTISSRSFDPNIPVDDQNSSDATLKLLPLQNIQARLTFGYKF